MDNNVSDPIFNAVNAYLESDDKLAFQINGPWGIGKTYYVKNVVIESIKNDYKVVYLSLYGIGNLDLLKKELLIEILNIMYPVIPMNFLKRHSQQYRRVKNIASEIYSKSELFFQAIELGYSFFQEDILKKIDGQMVFVIDDLERISNKIDLRDLLGFIQSELLERLNSKVVLISNELALKKVIADSAKTGTPENNENTNESEYFKIKEKVIGNVPTPKS